MNERDSQPRFALHWSAMISAAVAMVIMWGFSSQQAHGADALHRFGMVAIGSLLAAILGALVAWHVSEIKSVIMASGWFIGILFLATVVSSCHSIVQSSRPRGYGQAPQRQSSWFQEPPFLDRQHVVAAPGRYVSTPKAVPTTVALPKVP